MKRSEMQTVRIKPAPVILVVGASPAFLRRCNEALAQVRAIAVETTLSAFSTLAAQTRALAVVMPETTFSSNASLFTAMAKDAGTRLVTYPSESVPQADLEQILGGVLDAIPASRA